MVSCDDDTYSLIDLVPTFVGLEVSASKVISVGHLIRFKLLCPSMCKDSVWRLLSIFPVSPRLKLSGITVDSTQAEINPKDYMRQELKLSRSSDRNWFPECLRRAWLVFFF